MLMIVGTYTDWFDSPITPWSTLFTLAVVIMISMFKEGAEDIKRHNADAVTNNQPTQRLNRCLDPSMPLFEQTQWSKLVVGNVVKVRNNEEVPADMILLTSSELYRIAHVETANIDGETNLKPKTSVKVEGDEWENIEQWQR
jgi:P-type E1-E2 ATPase